MTAGRVEVVVDDTSCLTAEQTAAHGITMLPLSLDLDDDEPKTSALQPLPLAVAYARAQERAGDAGVLALHLSKALSSTWQNARTAAAAVGRCEAPDTATIGAALGVAAVAAAEESARGGDLESCRAAAEDVLRRSRLWIYVPKLDAMRRGGRISAGQAVLSTALSIKPVIGLSDGALHVEAKCRTEAKALETIVDRCIAAAGGRPARAVVQHGGKADRADGLRGVLEVKLPAGSEVTTVSLPPALIAHAGPEACAVSLVVADGGDDPGSSDADGASGAHPADAARTTAGPDGSPLVTTVTSKLPTWSANRRAAKERAEALQRAIAELALRDTSDPEGARFGAASKRESGGDSAAPAADADPGAQAGPGAEAGHADARDDASRDD